MCSNIDACLRLLTPTNSDYCLWNSENKVNVPSEIASDSSCAEKQSEETI